jgi:hypothetical protein
MDLTLTDEHDKAEIIAKELKIDFVLNKAKTGLILNGTVLTAVRIKTLYAQYRAPINLYTEPYINPERLLTLLIKIAQIQKIGESMPPSEKSYDSALDFLKDQFKAWNIQIQTNDLITEGEGNDLKHRTITALQINLRLAARAYNRTVDPETGGVRISLEELDESLEHHITEIRANRPITLRDKIIFNQKSTLPLDEYISGLLTIYFIQPTSANIEAFKHLLWQIKRKLWALPVPYPMMFILYGRTQGLGKSTFFKKLVNPFIWVHSEAGTIMKLVRENDRKALVQGKYLIDCPETHIGSARSDDATVGDIADILKSVITEETIENRAMRTTVNEVIINSATYVSSTNKHIWEVINDATGMRRYWEFEMLPPKNFDPLFYYQADPYFEPETIIELFRAIDENNPNGFYNPEAKVWNSMQLVQKTYCRLNPFYELLQKQKWFISTDTDPDAVWVYTTELLKEYNKYLAIDSPHDKRKPNQLRWIIRQHNDGEPYNKEGKEGYYVKGWTKKSNFLSLKG